jgi:hypothetical protein
MNPPLEQEFAFSSYKKCLDLVGCQWSLCEESKLKLRDWSMGRIHGGHYVLLVQWHELAPELQCRVKIAFDDWDRKLTPEDTHDCSLPPETL